MSRRSMILLIVIAVAIVAAMCVGAFVLVRSSRTPQTHLVPHGYKGWVSVANSVDRAPTTTSTMTDRRGSYCGKDRSECKGRSGVPTPGVRW